MSRELKYGEPMVQVCIKLPLSLIERVKEERKKMFCLNDFVIGRLREEFAPKPEELVKQLELEMAMKTKELLNLQDQITAKQQVELAQQRKKDLESEIMAFRMKDKELSKAFPDLKTEIRRELMLRGIANWCDTPYEEQEILIIKELERRIQNNKEVV